MKIVVIGHGGHSKVIRDVILSQGKFEIIGFLDDRYEGFSIDNFFYGPVKYAETLVQYFFDIKFIVAIGDNKMRKKVVRDLNIPDEFFVTLVHHSAVISPSSKMGIGSVVMPNTVINADSDIGKHTIINTGAVIEHDCRIGDFVHVSPRSVVTGSVQLEEGVLLGAGATIIPNIKVEEWSVIGAGAAVIDHIPSHCTAVGIPARVMNVNMGAR